VAQAQLTLVVGKTRKEHVASICEAWSNTAAGFIETGRRILEAKGPGPNALPHGEFMQMAERELPFSLATAEQLMAIARNRVLSNSAHAPILPASWMTLYELTRLSEEVLEAKIADGTINPKTERKDVITLRRPPPEPGTEPPIKLPGGPHADCVQLERLAQRWDDHALAAAIMRILMAARRAPDAPKAGEG
jgi:hypothetical protein